MSKPRGIYLMTETGCLAPHSGAFMHISIGLEEIRKYAEMHIVTNQQSLPWVKEGKFVTQAPVSNPPSTTSGTGKTARQKNKLWGALRDIRYFLLNIRELPRMYREIKSLKPDFIYERSAYLSFAGIILARWLKIPHFYEVNGLLFEDIREHYLSFLNPVAEYLEKSAYRKSDLAFCVGGTGPLLRLGSENVVVVQNGIKSSFIEGFRNHRKDVDGPLNACFIGHLMEHHKIEVLFEAVSRMKTPEALHLHFIGGGLFKEKLAHIPPGIHYTYHGIVPHNQLNEQLQNFHIGLIPSSQPEASYMKLYTYGAGKLLAVVPGWENFRENFSDEQILFFEPDDVDSLAACLDHIVENKKIVHEYGEALYQHVIENFTWEKIFAFTFDQIHKKIGKENPVLQKAIQLK
ncbi:MAG: glycosyltransferase [Bacteroidia bacterium]|nr:glycosyltransferase [Bacteroidia bacterium]